MINLAHASDVLRRNPRNSDPSSVTYPVIKWKGTDFIISYQTVSHIWESPLFSCFPPRNKVFQLPYLALLQNLFVFDCHMFYPFNNQRPPLSNPIQADPYALLSQLLDRDCTLFLDFTSLDDNQDYKPNNTTIYAISDIRYLLSQMNTASCLDYFGMTLEEELVRATKADYTIICNTINSPPWLFRSQQELIDLQNQRFVNCRTEESGYEPFLPL